MARASHIHHELASLHADLNKPSRAAAKAKSHAAKHERTTNAAEEANASFAADLEEQLKELSKALSEYSGNVEDFIAEHPLASVLGAFVLGVAIGQMVGRA
ncbi:hypothetical protein DC522_18580 [Microvirga sp. KLBC 81]|uniref:hypothetical protein n=1 Tax=Microvirga sp. KLBC 81 TaxID=1862707 RepID=UPI000D51AF1F|nr:hypothetical protein [Microvirga sp. KLBC 81]PVE22873.1 hypothetical protein DC522_18580 [Microvirga sp. KLBC 81]